MALPKVVIRIPRKPKAILPSPFKPRGDEVEEPEALSGTVQNIKASAPEERLARALEKQDTQYEFRHTIGAPRGLPGWKELDFIVASFGQVYAVEVDTAFTHREKGRADVLHDAIVLAELKKEGLQVYPVVIHVDGESDLLTQENAVAWVKQKFPAAANFEGAVIQPTPEQARAPAQTPPVQVAAPRAYSQRERNERAQRRRNR
jgi:hypothetical protein